MKKNYSVPFIIFCVIFCLIIIGMSHMGFAQSCNRVKMLDDFSNPSLNLWGGVKDAYGVDGARCIKSYTKANLAYGNSGRSLQIEYDVETKNSFAFYFTRLNNADLSEYNYLSFMFKGKSGGEYCRIQLTDETDNLTIRSKVPLWDYLPGGPDTTWTKVYIPLDAFYNLPNRQSLDELAIVFENVQGRLNESDSTGTVHVDNILFGTFDPGFIKVDFFDDIFPGNPLGGNVGMFSQVSNDPAYSLQFSNQEFASSPNGLIATYEKSGDSDFGGVYFIFGEGKYRTYNDLSDYEHLSFKARALNDNVNPETFFVELVSFDDVRNTRYETVHDISGLTTTTKHYLLDLNVFRERFTYKRDLNKSKVGGFNILFEDNKVLSETGQVMFDDIGFRKAWYNGPDEQSPPTPTDILIDGEPVSGSITLSDNVNVTCNILGDVSRLESLSLIYRPKSEQEWSTYSQVFIDECADTYGFTLNPGRLPVGEPLYFRVLAENYNGQQSASSLFQISVNTLCPFFACDSLFKQSFQVYQFFRSDTGIYRDAARFVPPQFHPSSVANIGIGLISLCIADAMGWITNAEEQALLTLKAMNNRIPGFTPEKNMKGFFRHFIKMDTGEREWDSEFSTIDTAILVAGALFCQKYFSTDSITTYANELFLSVDWNSSIADPVTGEIFLTQDTLGVGGGTTYPFNEYMLVAWMAFNDSRNNQRATELWNNYYQDPRFLPKSSFEGISVLTDNPGHFLSAFVIQFAYYLCHYFTTNETYLDYFSKAMEVDKRWWRLNTDEPDYVWGFGAGAAPNPPVESGYNADNILVHPGTICSPHIIAGFIPADSSNIEYLKKLYSDSLGVYVMPDENGTKLLWRFSTEFPDWPAGDVQGIDFSSMLFGLASHPGALGKDFFATFNDFNFPIGTDVVKDPDAELPTEFSLKQNYPNPFNPVTKIQVSLPELSHVSISIFDLKGRLVDNIYQGKLNVGYFEFEWNATRFPSGAYFIKFETENYQHVSKCLLLK